MPTLYEKAPKTITAQAQPLIAKFHKELETFEVRIDFIMAYAPRDENGYPTGAAIKWQGLQAAGLCRILSLKDRAMGRGDVEIILDGDRWDNWSEEQQNALIDHELTHIAPVVNQKGVLQQDDLGRPKLKCRKHDFQVGWFHSIAQRHGIHSFEVQQARTLKEEAGQFYFQGEFAFSPKVAEVAWIAAILMWAIGIGGTVVLVITVAQ